MAKSPKSVNSLIVERVFEGTENLEDLFVEFINYRLDTLFSNLYDEVAASAIPSETEGVLQ